MTADSQKASVLGAGTRVGAFEIAHRLRCGGMGQVFRGTHVATGIPAAIKVACVGRDLDDDVRLEFGREVEAIARLDHPNIIAIYDHGTIDEAAAAELGPDIVEGAPYMAMEFASRGSLLDVRLPIDWTDLFNVTRAVLRGLGHAHSHGLVHRDVKPANILLGSTDDLRPCVKLADFGIADVLSYRRRTSGDYTASSVEAAIGTPRYMAPEQFRGHWRDYGPWTDLYATGTLVWELVTGAPLFDAANPYELARLHLTEAIPEFRPRFDVPPELLEWLRRLLAKDPHDRIRCAADAQNVLADVDGAWRHRLSAPAQALAVARNRAGATSVSAEGAPDALARVGLSLFALRSPPLVGRDVELAQIVALRDAAWTSRRPRVVSVGGPLGMGASYLAREATRRSLEDGSADLWPTPDPGATQGEFRYLSAALRLRYRCVGMNDEDTDSRLTDALHREGLDLADARVLAAAATLRAAPPSRLTAAVTRSLGALMLRLTVHKPLFVVLSPDAIAAGAGVLLRAVRALERDDTDIPVVFVVDLSANAIGDVGWEDRSDVHIELGPLSVDDCRRVIRSMLPLEPAIERFVIEATSGRPSDLLRMLRAWTAGSVLLHTSSGFVFDESADWLTPGRGAASSAPRLSSLRPVATAARADGVASENSDGIGLEAHDECVRRLTHGQDGALELASTLLDLLDAHNVPKRDPRWGSALALRAAALAVRGDDSDLRKAADSLASWAASERRPAIQGDALMIRAWAQLGEGHGEAARATAGYANGLYALHGWKPGRALAVALNAKSSAGPSEQANPALHGLYWLASVDFATRHYRRFVVAATGTAPLAADSKGCGADARTCADECDPGACGTTRRLAPITGPPLARAAATPTPHARRYNEHARPADTAPAR